MQKSQIVIIFDSFENSIRNLATTASGNIVAFEAIPMDRVQIWKYELVNRVGTWRNLRELIPPSSNALLSRDGSALAVSTIAGTCDIFSWMDLHGNWTLIGGPFNGTCKSLNSEGPTLATMNSDGDIRTYHWNGRDWTHQRGTTGGLEAQVLLSGGISGAGTILTVGRPLDDSTGMGRGKTSTYKIHNTTLANDDICLKQANTMVLEIMLDAAPNETIWEIRDHHTKKVLEHGGPYSEALRYSFIVHEALLSKSSCVEFTIFDIGEDGMCCSKGFGSYAVYFGGKLQTSGGQFHWAETHHLGNCERLVCAQGKDLVQIDLATDNSPYENKWMISGEDIIIRGLPYEEMEKHYSQEFCVDSRMCATFRLEDSKSNGFCCDGSYSVFRNNKLIGNGAEFRSFVTFPLGNCAHIQSRETSYISIRIEMELNVFTRKSNRNKSRPRWLLYKIESGDILSGNSSVSMELEETRCYLLRTVGAASSNIAISDKYSLFVGMEEIVSGGSFALNHQHLIGNCRHVFSTFNLDVGKNVICRNGLSNICLAPASCAADGLSLEPISENVLGSALSNGEWVAAGAYDISFNRSCSMSCFGRLSTTFACSDNELPVYVYLSRRSFTWTVADQNQNVLFEGGPYFQPNVVTTMNDAILARMCIPVDRCLIFTIRGVGNYSIYIEEDVLSGTTSHNFLAVETVCPHLTIDEIPISNNASSVLLPNNDDCVNAQNLLLGVEVYGSTRNATVKYMSKCDTARRIASPGVWYSVTGTGKELFVSSCGSTYDTQVAVFEGSCNSLLCVAGSADDLYDVCYHRYNEGPIYPETKKRGVVSWTSTSNITYFVLVHGNGFEYGTHRILLGEYTLPTNGKCTNAVVLQNNKLTYSSLVQQNGFTETHNCGYFNDNGYYVVPGEIPILSVAWFEITGTGNFFRASTCSSFTNVDTRILVLDGTCRKITCMTAYYDFTYSFCGRHWERVVDWESMPNVTYYILVYTLTHSWDYVKPGNFSLLVGEVPPTYHPSVTWMPSSDAFFPSDTSINNYIPSDTLIPSNTHFPIDNAIDPLDPTDAPTLGNYRINVPTDVPASNIPGINGSTDAPT